jgi:glycosyltransferase involved in cell wall biosynthesis
MLNAGRGSGEVARHQMRYLANEGHTVSFLVPGEVDPVPGVDHRGVRLHDTTLPVHEYLPSAGEGQEAVSLMSGERAFAYVDDYVTALDEVGAQADILFAHHGNLTAIAAAVVGARYGKPYVLFLHGTGIEPRHHDGYDDDVWTAIAGAIEGAAGILVTTEYVRDELVRPLVDLPEDRFLVLPCAIDLDEFSGGPDRGVLARYGIQEPFVLCPGALTEVKGPQNVVDASREYADLALTVFIGDGEMRQSLETDLAGRGRFLGFVPAADKAALIRSATILTAAPEKREHFGIIYAEALAAGTPPVAYEGGGVPSVVTPEVGVLTRRDPRSLGRGIRELLQDADRRASMSAAGRRRAQLCFHPQALGVALEDWLRGLSAAG